MFNKFALISVTDKTGIIDISKFLADAGYSLITTSGTSRYLSENNIKNTEISDFTGFPEILDGRVKTLHHKVFSGLLADRNNTAHIDEIKKHGFPSIDVVICNFYDFNSASKKKGNEAEAIKNIDVGGVAITRAAAKNFNSVSILTSPEQYLSFKTNLSNGSLTYEYRKRLAIEAFRKTALYDFQISNYFLEAPEFPYKMLKFDGVYNLSYGENPHQSAILYPTGFDKYFIEQLSGAPISYNNILDINAALKLSESFEGENFCAIFKHTNPCGAAVGVNPCEAYLKAFRCDTVSAYGGVAVFNKRVDINAARAVIKNFTEAVAAPEFDEDAQKIFAEKKRIRLIAYSKKNINAASELKSTYVGMLVQDSDLITEKDMNFNSVTSVKAEENLYADIKLGIKICKSLKSNAIVLTKSNMSIGLCGGQPNRIESIEISINNARKFGFELENSVLVSDGFFPFTDSVEIVKNQGIKTIVQPGGSKRDKEVIDACEKYGIALILTGRRHFLH
ncbi:MAG TPA: bifunctional phosphoribosylaminoimidazolecarboxamide formyltransferase/IMP cyclohydrolase [bacterium]|nr:bifunctional phosphoribosylaminoimidazolecarboxamide formyltransferase/IMP cyclohydrolase [bacterium]HPN29701.1 bifunctional phosphoribosylaminoimidazolecarboxamide formyltransferase/IMP cyclohydrolase [bacterium]